MKMNFKTLMVIKIGMLINSNNYFGKLILKNHEPHLNSYYYSLFIKYSVTSSEF